MSERKRELPVLIAGLLRSLASPAADGDEIDVVPADFALPPKSIGAIHAAVEFSGTVATSSLPAERINQLGVQTKEIAERISETLAGRRPASAFV